MKTDNSVEKGFTLLELLAVLSVVGILAALLLPALSTAKSYANTTTCKKHLHQMGAVDCLKG